MSTDRLRLVLRLNATTSAAGGLVALVAAPWVSETLGIDHTLLTGALGAGLLGFAALVVWASTRSEQRLLTETLAISLADAGWVIATVLVVALGLLTPVGVVVALVIGLAVADFGLMQWWLRSRILRNAQSLSNPATRSAQSAA